MFQEVETIEGCTVQILEDPDTGEVSVGWWKDEPAKLKLEVEDDKVNIVRVK